MEHLEGTGLQRLAVKLERSKVTLQVWNKTIFGHINQHISHLENQLNCLEACLQERDYLRMKQEFIAIKGELEL